MLSGIQRYIMSGGRLGSQTYNICRSGYFQLTNIIRTFVEYNKYYQPQKAMEEPFDYSQVPFTFGMCAALTVRVANTFRYRMIGYLGRKNYYLKRSGKLALTPAEQQWIINTAKELGVIQSEYFDSYIVEYNWDR